MRIALLLIVVGIVIFGPQLWTRRVFAQHSVPRPDFPGTGAELARHLLDRLDMKHIKVEMTEMGDHYDPETKTVCLMPDKFTGKSLTAVTVAAHEVGHAIQDPYRLSATRGAHAARADRPRGGKGWRDGDDGHSDCGGDDSDPYGRCICPSCRDGDDGDLYACAPPHSSGRMGRKLQTCPSRAPKRKLPVAAR